MAKVLSLVFLLFAVVVCSAPATCAQTTEFTYQGSLRDGAAPASGNYDFEFLLFDAVVDGSQIGSTLSQNGVSVSNGVFVVNLDFGNQFPGANRYLEIHVRQTGGGAFTILTPRQSVTSVPYSVKSLSADSATSAATATNATQLNGQPPAFYQNAANLSSGTLPNARLAGAYTGALTLSNAGNAFTGAFSGSGAGLTTLNASNLSSGTLAAARLPNPLTLTGTSVTHIIRGENGSTGVFARGVHGAATGGTGATIGVLGESASTSGAGVAGLASAATGTTSGVSGQSDSTSGRGVFGSATAAIGATFGGRFESTSTSGRGVYGLATAATGTAYGGRFESASTSGVGVAGVATALFTTTYGVLGQSDATFGRGVYGLATANSGGETFGVYGQIANSTSERSAGVYGLAAAGTGFTNGVRGESASTSGRGVYGRATAATGNTNGVYGRSDSENGSGVVGEATSTTTIFSATSGVRGESAAAFGRGVFGHATANSGTNYGVGGITDSPAGYGVYSFGELGASGVKSFRIDHPNDPENKYLLHYAAESPEVINFYRGTVVLDGAGEAVVALPHYFAKINKTPSYQLTAVGSPMPMLHVAEEIDEAALSAGATAEAGQAAPACSFRIAGGAPGAKVSWRVEAVRNDRWVQKRGAPVEVEKQGMEKGTYQHPELYGQPKEKGMNYDAARKRP